MNRIPIVLALVPLFAAASGQTAGIRASPYAGQETRTVKSFSPEDIAELRRGGGWGLAKAAELNCQGRRETRPKGGAKYCHHGHGVRWSEEIGTRLGTAGAGNAGRA